LAGDWVAGDDAYGTAPTLRDALDADHWRSGLDVPTITPVCTDLLTPAAAVPVVAAALPAAAWQEVTVADGAQGPRRYAFVACRVWDSREGQPGRACWLLARRTLDGTEPRYYLANAPADTALGTLAAVAATRWVIETDFQTAKGETGLDEYEVRSWRGWHHHSAFALLAGAFLLTLQQDWGGNTPLVTRPQLSRLLRELLPHRHWTITDLCTWLAYTQACNAHATHAHHKRRQLRQREPAALPVRSYCVVVVLVGRVGNSAAHKVGYAQPVRRRLNLR
jgi:hypothetical protein